MFYDGVQKLKSENLITYDSTENGEIETADGKKEIVQFFRDGLNCLTVNEDESAKYVLLGIENQSDVHYAMPVKNMTYNALDYHSQVKKKAKEHRTEKEQRKIFEEENIRVFWVSFYFIEQAFQYSGNVLLFYLRKIGNSLRSGRYFFHFYLVCCLSELQQKR